MNTLEMNTKKLVTDVNALVSDSQELLRNSSGAMGDEVQLLREKLNKAIEATKAASRKLEERTMRCVRASDETIRSHPYQAIAIGVGVGAVAGYVLSRLNRD